MPKAVEDFVAHDVLQLFGGALHQPAPLQGEDMGGEAVVEPAAFEDDGEEEVGKREFVEAGPVAQVEVGAQDPFQPAVGQADLGVDRRHHPIAGCRSPAGRGPGFRCSAGRSRCRASS